MLVHLQHKKVNSDLDAHRKVVTIIDYCREIEVEITRRNLDLEAHRKTVQQEYEVEKEKRIQCEYNVKLLRERSQDEEKRKDFFRSCYNEERIQTVIDDMLDKEDSLRH
jgi:hypothetical protein